jgi:hypothetical protein
MMLFLGAGASKPFGIPAMKEMSEEFENSTDLTKEELYLNIKNTLGSDNLEDILTVLNDLREESGNPSVKYLKSLINEAAGPIFSPFEVREENKKSIKLPKIEERSKNLWETAIRLIKENCIINNDKRENIAKIYDELFKIIEKSNSLPITINIFTTNYDLIIEEYFKRKGEELYDGFFFGNQWEPSSDYTGIIPGKKFIHRYNSREKI